jgi:sugar phosphate isomerase/epimerase
MTSPFQIAVVTDELTQDFGRACEIAAREFGLEWIEIRTLWNKNILKLDAKEVAEARRILEHHLLRVTDIATPLFKVDWPGAPRSKFGMQHDQFGADFTFEQQDEVLERSIELARTFDTGLIRCFDFWRLDDPMPYRAAMDDKLFNAAEKAGKHGMTLMLENEFACNTATGAESARLLNQVQSKHFMLNWDPGNAFARGDKPYPDGYSLLPRNRIAHCHCKDAIRKPGGDDSDWAVVGGGAIDWVGQFRALKNDGYKRVVSLETHWRGAGTAEESTRQSWAGMKDAMRKAGTF